MCQALPQAVTDFISRNLHDNPIKQMHDDYLHATDIRKLRHQRSSTLHEIMQKA